MEAEELQKLIEQPESDVLEFKLDMPNPVLAAKWISAFANTKGGTLVFGLKDWNGPEIVGLDNPEYGPCHMTGYTFGKANLHIPSPKK